MRRALSTLGAVVVASALMNGLPPEPRNAAAPVYAVPDGDTAVVRKATDSLFAHLGVAFDSVVLNTAKLLELYVQRGMLTRRMRMTDSGCTVAADPYPATRHVAERMYASYARDRAAIAGIAVRIYGDSAIGGGWFDKRTCSLGRSPSASYYYRAQLDSLLGASGSRPRD